MTGNTVNYEEILKDSEPDIPPNKPRIRRLPILIIDLEEM